jgi:hypothetical protein
MARAVPRQRPVPFLEAKPAYRGDSIRAVNVMRGPDLAERDLYSHGPWGRLQRKIDSGRAMAAAADSEK